YSCNGQKCEAGACVAACTRNTANACSDGKCWDLQNDPDHCGATCRNCSSTQFCDAGACDCPAGSTSCSGTCANLQRDPAPCGSCTRVCNGRESCLSGECMESTPALGCTSCPCDFCTFNKHWRCCMSAQGPTCVEAEACP